VIFIPEDFARAMLDLHGAEGARWLRELPATVERCCARWSLKVGRPFASLSYNYAARAEGAGGERLVLKVGVPVPELLSEMAALRMMEGRGAVRLLDADAEAGALLLERLEPGTPLVALSEVDDARATSAAAAVMRELWRPVPHAHSFPSVADWGRGFRRMRERFGGGSGPFPPKLVDEAEALFAELLDSSAAPVVLHGDLHHGNILAAARAPWLAIDPKGLVGEPAYEVGALLRNPLPQLLNLPRPVRVSERRIAQLAEELGFDRARVRGWGVAQAVLAGWWSFEDTGRGGEFGIASAEILAAVKP
jgi:streptomycin 6-kinase